MKNWRNLLCIDPIPALSETGLVAIQYYVNRDLLEANVEPIQNLWNLPEPRKILKKQLPDGSWPRADNNQQPDGLWKTNYYTDSPEKSSPQVLERKYWVSLAICGILKQLEN